MGLCYCRVVNWPSASSREWLPDSGQSDSYQPARCPFTLHKIQFDPVAISTEASEFGRRPLANSIASPPFLTKEDRQGIWLTPVNLASCVPDLLSTPCVGAERSMFPTDHYNTIGVTGILVGCPIYRKRTVHHPLRQLVSILK